MTVVIDVGCARYGGDYSIERLVDEFQPDVLYGFDPNGASLEGLLLTKTNLKVSTKAAWTYDGEIGFLRDGLNSCLTDRTDVPMVPCFDLAAFIIGLDQTGIILKIDAEGSEYELMRHLIVHRADALLELAWIEWHNHGVTDPVAQRKMIEATAACRIEEWRW